MSNPLRLILHPGILIWAVKRLTEVYRITSLFYFALVKQSHFAEMGLGPSGNYYEFGVGRGGTLTCYLKALKAFVHHFHDDPIRYRVFGFDTFEGLPPKRNIKDASAEWKEGLFSMGIDEIRAKANSLASKVGLLSENIRFIKGLFSESLTQSLRDELKQFPPAIVCIDVDYYSSTMDVLSRVQ